MSKSTHEFKNKFNCTSKVSQNKNKMFKITQFGFCCSKFKTIQLFSENKNFSFLSINRIGRLNLKDLFFFCLMSSPFTLKYCLNPTQMKKITQKFRVKSSSFGMTQVLTRTSTSTASTAKTCSAGRVFITTGRPLWRPS